MDANKIKQKAVQLGYTDCKIIPVQVFEEYRKALDERSEAFPNSKEAYANWYGLVEPPAEGKSIIVCALGHSKYKIPNMAKYYAKHYLFSVNLPYTQEHRAKTEFETFLKINKINILDAGVPDRWAAAKSGLGKFGRNNFIYMPQHGSNLVICTWVVDAVLDYDPIQTDTTAKECKEGCMLCVQACPTAAMDGEFSMEFERCAARLSYNTDLPDAATRKQMGEWMYGCDVCQDVCPMNKDIFTEEEDYPLLADFEEHMQLENILEMDEETYKNIVNPRFWYIGEDALWKWKCNALRVMINAGDDKYYPLIEKYCTHEDERVREVAQEGWKVISAR